MFLPAETLSMGFLILNSQITLWIIALAFQPFHVLLSGWNPLRWPLNIVQSNNFMDYFISILQPFLLISSWCFYRLTNISVIPFQHKCDGTRGAKDDLFSWLTELSAVQKPVAWSKYMPRVVPPICWCLNHHS